MFTGLIVETGTVAGVRRLQTGVSKAGTGSTVTRITVAAAGVPGQLKTGDSVAVSGVCLTAVEVAGDEFAADLARETLERTTLGELKPGSVVNLELPARAQDRLGGHVVQGHVDGVGKLLRFEKIASAEDRRLEIEIPPSLAKYVAPQGSITVEGISLTVAAISASRVQIAIIPHTYRATNLQTLRPGDPLNIEVDVLAKYAEKMAPGRESARLDLAELIRQGF